MSALTGKKQLCIDQNHLQPSSVYHITAVITARWDGRLVLTMYSSIFNYKEFPFSKPHFTVWVSACLDLGKTEGTPLHYRGPVIINCMLATRLIDVNRPSLLWLQWFGYWTLDFEHDDCVTEEVFTNSILQAEYRQ